MAGGLPGGPSLTGSRVLRHSVLSAAGMGGTSRNRSQALLSGDLHPSGKERPVNKHSLFQLVINAMGRNAAGWENRGHGEGAERCCNCNKSEQRKLSDKKMPEQNGASPGDVWEARSRSCACPTSELRSHVNSPASGPSALITAVHHSLEQTMTRMRDFNSRGPFGLSSSLSLELY